MPSSTGFDAVSHNIRGGSARSFIFTRSCHGLCDAAHTPVRIELPGAAAMWIEALSAANPLVERFRLLRN